MKKKLEIELSGPDLARCLDILRGLSFSQIQMIVPNGDEEEAYRSQRSLLRLREQLECLLEAIESIRDGQADRETTYDLYYIGGRKAQRLTENFYASSAEVGSLISEVIQHTEEALREPVDDPQNYVIMANS